MWASSKAATNVIFAACHCARGRQWVTSSASFGVVVILLLSPSPIKLCLSPFSAVSPAGQGELSIWLCGCLAAGPGQLMAPVKGKPSK